MRNRPILAVIGVALLAASSQASAQRGRIYSRDYDRDYDRPIELGVDAGVSFGLDEPNVTTIGIPVRSIRAGFFFTDQVSLEPSFGLASTHIDDDTFTQYQAAIALLLHLSRPTSGLYVRPFAGITGVSGGGDSDSDGFVGAGIGAKIPWGNRRLASRLEANFAHGFDGDGTNAIGLLAGISVFIR